jgi:hypothetical protein
MDPAQAQVKLIDAAFSVAADQEVAQLMGA